MTQTVIKDLLATSATLFHHLTEVPDGDDRDAYIARIDELLDKRGALLAQLTPDAMRGHQLLPHLLELDEGIRLRLDHVMNIVKKDIKNFQKSRETERQYTNQYDSVRNLDGMYYDGKK